MLHIVNYTHKEVNLGNGVKIAPRSVSDLDIEYTPIMINLAKSGIISITDAQNCGCNNVHKDANTHESDNLAERIRIANAKRASSSK